MGVPSLSSVEIQIELTLYVLAMDFNQMIESFLIYPALSFVSVISFKFSIGVKH